ncbi:putative ribonuclease H-like domain-containing protein [Tanacetum coccineum]
MVPRVVLMKSGLVSINTARQNISKIVVLVNTARQVNTAYSKTTVNAARPMLYLSKIAHSTVKRPINNITAFKNSNINQRDNTVSGKNINTARPKAVVNVVQGNNLNAVKASAYWVWKPKTKGNLQIDLQNKGVIDSGCSRHMTGNMSYLIDYEEIDGGYVAFGGNPKGGKITRKATKDETSGILKSFISGIENLVDHKVKVIRCDNGTEFKNREMNQFCETKGILRQFSLAKTPKQNEVAKRRNMTLIEAAETMLADSKLSTTFWAEAVNTACYVQKRVLVVKPHNKTSKAFRVFNSRTRIVEENLHIRFSESTPNVVGTQSNGFAGTKASDNAGQARKETKHVKDHILLPMLPADSFTSFLKIQRVLKMMDPNLQVMMRRSIELPDDPNMPALEDISIFDLSRDNEDVGAEADMNNLDTTIQEEPKKVFMPLKESKLYIDFVVYQLDVKSAFLYGKIEKEVYGCQPPGFEDLDFPDRVYKVKKALYRLHQAPRAWYETLLTYLLDNEFQRGKIDKTLFIKRYKGDILLVQVYVDDINFGSTKKELCNAFEKLMHEKFQMSSIGELIFFLGLEVQ